MSKEHVFQTEVHQLLELIIHSLYSHKEIFLRELISNASDALDKLNYLSLSDENFKDFKFSPEIHLSFSKDERILRIEDNGIGMTQEELIGHLGTIARSGTKNFLSAISQDSQKTSQLIGQFGVGFYSSFMVAERVEVLSRKAGEEHASLWISDGKNAFTIDEAQKETHGTQITLHLNEEGIEYADRWALETNVKKYSNHIAFPIFLHYVKTVPAEKEGEKESSQEVSEQINSANAMWQKPKTSLSPEDYHEFFKNFAHQNDDPLLYIHMQAEGTLEYTTLFFVPQKAPFNLYQADYPSGVKLYVNRVFITDDQKEILPLYLRFVYGIIDSRDLPLNVSREILQQNRVMQKIRDASVKKILQEFVQLQKNPELYTRFITEFNRPLKEGLYSDYSNRELLEELVRFKSSTHEGYVGLAEYKERMSSDQKEIYILSGNNETIVRKNPLLESYTKKGYEVLLFVDEIDEFIIPLLHTYKELPIKAINRSDADLEEKDKPAITPQEEALLHSLREFLGDAIKDVKKSYRLEESPSCIVIDEHDPSFQMQGLLKAMGQAPPPLKPILEVKLEHPLLADLDKLPQEEGRALARVLLDQALLSEGILPSEPTLFVKSLNTLLEKKLHKPTKAEPKSEKKTKSS